MAQPRGNNPNVHTYINAKKTTQIYNHAEQANMYHCPPLTYQNHRTHLLKKESTIDNILFL